MEMERGAEVNPSCEIPKRMFAIGEELVGVRVTPYHKPTAINNILRALDEDEVGFLRNSQFGKLVEISEKPSFSGCFGRFIISRQLKVKKKHEAWFLFAGKPIRFSLAEFAYVTGLNCGQYPANAKQMGKKDINEKPYWGELFGTLKEVLVESVIRMLKKKSVTGKETRIKYALLALLAAVLLPTTHTPRISQDHAEMIIDLDIFLAFPWGRLSFDLLMTSIKERNEVSLSQNTIALKGFVLALQLVMVAAVPALTEAVHEGGSSGSEGDAVDDDDSGDDDEKGKGSISPGNARDMDSAGKATVVSIISVRENDGSEVSEFGWGDDVSDDAVDNLVQLMNEGFAFQPTMFTGGASKTNVARMRVESRTQAVARKGNRPKSNQVSGEAVDVESLVSGLKDHMAEEIRRVGREVKSVGESLCSFETKMVLSIQEMLNNFRGEIIKVISPPVMVSQGQTTEPIPANAPFNYGKDGNRIGSTTPSSQINTEGDVEGILQSAMRFVANVDLPNFNGERCGVDEHPLPKDFGPTGLATGETASPHGRRPSNESVLDGSLVFSDPSFSLGVTQEKVSERVTSLVTGADGDVDEVEEAPHAKTEAPGQGFRKSKRQKVVSRALVDDYECDKTILARAWEAHVARGRKGENIDYAAKVSKLLDLLEKPFSFAVNGVTVTSKDVSALLEKSSHVPAKVVDVLIHNTRAVFKSHSELSPQHQSVFLDTKFVAQLSKLYGRFGKANKKETFKFPVTIIDCLVAGSPTLEATRFYFPFNFDKMHWVGVCIDSSTWQLVILDCNTSIRTDGMINKDMMQIAACFLIYSDKLENKSVQRS